MRRIPECGKLVSSASISHAALMTPPFYSPVEIIMIDLDGNWLNETQTVFPRTDLINVFELGRPKTPEHGLD